VDQHILLLEIIFALSIFFHFQFMWTIEWWSKWYLAIHINYCW